MGSSVLFGKSVVFPMFVLCETVLVCLVFKTVVDLLLLR